jgi:hypothetical protein
MDRRGVNTANLKPFKKGPDPRRNPTGGVCKERAAWEQKFRNALAEKADPCKLAQVLVDAAMRAKRPWAIEIILDRLIGKSVQPLSGPPGGDGSLTIKVVQVKDGNGNGNTHI